MRVVQYVAVHWQSRVRQRLQTGSVALGKDQLGRCGLLHPGFDSPYGHAVHLSTRTCAPDEAHGCHHRPLADLVVASLRLASPRKRRILGQRSLCNRFMLGLLRWYRRCCHNLSSLAKGSRKGIDRSAERACSASYHSTASCYTYACGAGGTGMAGLVKQLRNSSHLRWVAPALLVDWIVVIVVNLLAQWVELQYPYKRDPAHYLDDPSLQWPVTEEHVPAGPHSALDNYTFWLPVVVILVVGGIFKRSLHDVHHGFLVFMSSRTLMRVVVECLKNRVRKTFSAPSSLHETADPVPAPGWPTPSRLFLPVSVGCRRSCVPRTARARQGWEAEFPLWPLFDFVAGNALPESLPGRKERYVCASAGGLNYLYSCRWLALQALSPLRRPSLARASCSPACSGSDSSSRPCSSVPGSA